MTRNEIEKYSFHIATNGNDDWEGTKDKPFASLNRGLQAARQINNNVPKRLIIGAGRYYEVNLALDAQDSGLTIEALSDEKVLLYGGRRLTGWQTDGEKFWSAAVPEVKEGKWDFRALVVNGRLADRSRLPGTGRFKHLSEFKVRWMSTSAGGWQRKPTLIELTTLQYRPEDLGTWLNINNAELTVYHVWDESTVGLAAHDPVNHQLTFASPAAYPPGAFGVQEYVVWNTREGLTEPGQWFLDRSNGRLVYWPRPGEDMAKIEIIAPTVESIIRVAGTEGHPVKNITIRGLTLTATTTPCVAGGFGAKKYDGAVSVKFTEDCCLSDLEICSVAGQGIKASGRRLRIEGCHIHHTGACGIFIDGSDSVIENTHIHHIGALYPSGIGLYANKAVEINIRHNEIHDTPYTAICSTGNDSVIQANLIYRCMQQLRDGAGIYITFCRNTRILGNFVRDIIDRSGRGSGPSAYYLDEQAEDCLVEGNLALNVAGLSNNHMARRNILRNNVFMAEDNATLSFARCTDYSFERNIVCAAGKLTFINPQAVAQWHANILFSTVGVIEGLPLINDGYTKGQAAPLDATEERVFADPQLNEYQTGKIAFGPTSPALRLGIMPIDVSTAGLTNKKGVIR